MDERGVEHPDACLEAISRCNGHLGIASTGLVIRGSDALELLAHMRFECVILGEAHRARRRNRGPGAVLGQGEPNNLLRVLWLISSRTRSLLLAAAPLV